MQITSQGPVNRHITEFLTTTPGVKQYKCKTLQNPDYYFDGQAFGGVDVSHKLDTSTAKAGGIWLRNKAIVSVGTKKTDDAYKLFGLRPDENQSGSESLEWSIESIEINGKSQTINLRDRVEVSDITTKFGDNLFVQRARQRCRIMIPGDSSTESFKISLRLHLKGCTVEYRADLDEYWIYRGGMFFCRLGKPYLVDPKTMNPIEGDFVKHTLTDLGHGEYRYTKEATAAFVSADLPASFLIDADTVYSSTADGVVKNYPAGTWANVWGAATGTSVDSSGAYNITAMEANWTGAAFRISRSFFYYNLAGLSGTVSACVEKIYGSDNNQSNCGSMQGTQADTLTTGDFDSFSGDSFGNTASWTIVDYNTITYGAGGCSAVGAALGSVMKTCVREYDHDYSNSEPAASYKNGCRYAEDTSGTKDPYLYITTAAAAKGALQHYRRLRA